MTEQILSLLNPIRILKVQDWEGIARITLQNEEAANAFDAQAYLDRRTVHTIMRFEQLASKPLAKELVLKWFAGFESNDKSVWFAGHPHFSFIYENGEIWLGASRRCVRASVFDFIYAITKYNETSDTKIDLRFTESFAEELIK